VAGGPSLGQDEPLGDPGDPGSGFGETMTVGNVLVPVVVRSGERHVRNLERDDFELFVDGRAVPIESFQKGAAAPVRVVVLQDVSGSMAIGGRLERSRDLVPFLVGRSRPGDRFALASFALENVIIDVPFTDDAQALLEAAATWRAHGTTGLHDAVAWLPEITVESPHLRHAAILLTDGMDNVSSTDPEEARRRVRQAKIPVYVIFLKRDVSGILELPEGAAEDEGGLLRLLAHETGGRYHSGEDRDALLRSAARILADLRYQYVLGFSTADSGAVRSRGIQVRVDRKNVELTHRHGYEGLAPDASGSGGM
jgi:VWFA-related protein